jgi:hypothetical protein
MINLEDHIYDLNRRNNPHRKTAVSFSFLGKLNPINQQELQIGKQYLKKLLIESQKQISISESPLIIGLAESGIIPSALMHQVAREWDIQAHWLCSTRREVAGVHFSESHSHQPDHVLPLYQHQPSEIWFVEDEITTGKTILNLILKLCPLLKVNSIRLFAFLDSRTPKETAHFQSTLTQHHIRCCTQSLLQSEKINKDIFKLKTTDIKSSLLQQQAVSKTVNSQVNYYSRDWHYPEQRAALNAQLNPISNLPTHLTGCLLAVGEVMDLALRLLQVNPGLLMQHVTLSPWEIDRVKIFNYLEANKYHIYNYKQLRSHIYILSDPLDRDVEWKITKLLEQQGLTVKSLSLDPVHTENQYAVIK